MKPVIKIEGDFRTIYRASITDGKRAVTRGVTDAGVFLQNDWRAQVQGSGLGPNLARTIRRQTYPKTGTSLRAAALVWSKASKIVDAFDRGVTIRSSDGFYLAVPLPAAGAKGLGRKRITPGGWEARTGRRLTFVYRKGRHPLRGARLAGQSGFRFGRHRRPFQATKKAGPGPGPTRDLHFRGYVSEPKLEGI